MSVDRTAAEAAERCLYCPRMCRFACPVAQESARETLTPWGKMTQLSMTEGAEDPPALAGRLDALARKALRRLDPTPRQPLDADTAEAFYGCTGCLRCATFCEHDNDVPHALYQGRADAVTQNLAPAAARAVADRFARHGHAQATDPSPALARLAADHPAPLEATTVFFAGCESPVSSPEAVSSTLVAAALLGAPMALVREPVCCGRPLFEAGYRDAFRAHVREVWDRLGESEVVLPSAACARALSEWARQVGVEPRGPVVHASTYLARRLGPQIQTPPLQGTVTYHDPCHLGRGLGEYDAPRRLLAAALAGGVAEAPNRRETSDCCGASGLVPRTFPEVARAMAMTRADELREVGPARVATACPSCQHALRTAGLDVVDVAEVVAQWLRSPATEEGG